MKHLFNIFKIANVVGFLLLCTTAQAQLETDQQEIVKEFEATLEDAGIQNVNPVINPVIPSKKRYDYKITIKPLEIKYPDPVIKPLAAEPDGAFESLPFYLKIGYGNKSNPFADLRWYRSVSEKADYFVIAKHYGLNNDKQIKGQKMSTSEATLGVKFKPRENLQLDVSALGAFDRRNTYYTGNAIADPQFTLKWRNTTKIGGTVDLFNIEPIHEAVNFKSHLGYSILNMGLPNKVEAYGDGKFLVSKHIAQWGITFPFEVNYTTTQGVGDRLNAAMQPHASYGSNKLFAKIGLHLFYNKAEKYVAWPLVLIDYALKGRRIHLFLSSEQDHHVNNLHRLSQVNPWLQSNLNSLPNVSGSPSAMVINRASAGIKGESSFLSYHAQLGYFLGRNMTSFWNATNPVFADFLAVDNSGVYFQANMGIALNSRIDIDADLIKNFYKDKMIGVPSMEFKGTASLKMLKDKLVLKPLLIVRDNTRAMTSVGEIDLNNQVEFSLGLQFSPHKKFGIYFDALNLLNNQYEPIYGYPIVGIHFNAGVIVKL